MRGSRCVGRFFVPSFLVEKRAGYGNDVVGIFAALAPLSRY